MRALAQQRRLVLFLAALLVPYAVLVAVSVRLVVQDRELRQGRGDSRQREMAALLRRELLARLETVRRDELRHPLPPGGRYRHPETAFVAWSEEGRLVLPWEEDEGARESRDHFARADVQARLRPCEQAEYESKGLERAASCYQRAAAAAADALEAAHARVLWMRLLDRTGRNQDAADRARELLDTPPDLVDEDGVAFRLYAAQRLAHSHQDLRNVVDRAGEIVSRRPWLPPMACYVASEIAAGLPQDGPDRDRVESFRRKAAAHVRLVEQAEALQTEFARLGTLRGSGPGQPGWVCYGEEMWLVGPGAPARGRTPILAVRGADVFGPVGKQHAVRFTDTREPRGWPLGEDLANLKVILADPGADALRKNRELERWLYYSSLCLIAAAMMFVAYLLWRDLRRELRLSDLRSQFVSSVSHELKTPLTSIRMLAETLQMGRAPNPQTQEEYLDTIVNECERLSRLVDDVLLFSRSEQGKKSYRFRATRLEDTVRAAVRALSYPLAQRGFELHVNVEPGLPDIRADRDALEQAVLNLLGNAMKYSGQSRDIELDVRRDSGNVVIRVTDHGVGIAPEEQRRIFEKFYRVSTPENQLIPGTGLGLALVSQIVKAHGGRVEVESEPGKGSTFSIRLPSEETV